MDCCQAAVGQAEMFLRVHCTTTGAPAVGSYVGPTPPSASPLGQVPVGIRRLSAGDRGRIGRCR
jgi:hypothetical protein